METAISMTRCFWTRELTGTTCAPCSRPSCSAASVATAIHNLRDKPIEFQSYVAATRWTTLATGTLLPVKRLDRV